MVGTELKVMNLQSVIKTYFTHTIGQQQKNERNLNNKNELCDLITALELKVKHGELACLQVEL